MVSWATNFTISQNYGSLFEQVTDSNMTKIPLKNKNKLNKKSQFILVPSKAYQEKAQENYLGGEFESLVQKQEDT